MLTSKTLSYFFCLYHQKLPEDDVCVHSYCLIQYSGESYGDTAAKFYREKYTMLLRVVVSSLF